MPANGLMLAATLAAAAPAQPLPARLPPIDECRSDEGFALFRDTLASAAAREDGQALSALLAPELRANAEDYWPRIRMLLRMGCIRSGEARVLPSALKQLERFGPDSRAGKFLVIPGADLLETTEDPNSIVDGAVLKWDVVTATNIAGHIWTGVQLRDGRSGWIIDADLYSLEYPSVMTVEKRDGQWVITGFE